MNFLKNNIQHLSYVFKYLKERLFCIIIFLIIIISILFLIVNNSEIKNPKQFENQQMIISGISLENWSTLITIVGLGFTAIWSMFQYSKNKLLSQQEKASQIAKIFADSLVEKLHILTSVLSSDEEYSKLLEKINVDKLNSFSVYEMQSISSEKNIISKFRKILEKDSIQKVYEEKLEDRYGDNCIGKFEKKFLLLLQNTMNELEYNCMAISSNAAGSQFIYPSLHQIFLRSIYILSPYIAENNVDNVDKYFINIIQVYNMWKLESLRDEKKFLKTQKKLKRLRKKQEQEIKKLLDKNPGRV